MYLPPVMRPLAASNWTAAVAVDRPAASPISILRGPPGSYVAEGLAATLAQADRWHNSVWLRQQDWHPRPPEAALVAACRHRWFGEQASGGLDDGTAAGESLVRVLSRAPRGSAIVLELGSRLERATQRLLQALRPVASARQASLIAVTESRFGSVAAFGSAGWRQRGDLVRTRDLLGHPHLAELAEAVGLSGSGWEELGRLAGPQTALLHDVARAAERWSAAAVAEALDRARAGEDFMDVLTALLLRECSPEEQAALEVSVATGYWHPMLITWYGEDSQSHHPPVQSVTTALPDAPGQPVPRSVTARRLRPWLVPLEEEWGWLRPIWAGPLRRQLALQPRRLPPDPRSLDRVCVQEPRPAPRPVVQARLLGAFELRVDGTPVTNWKGPRGVSVLRFLFSRDRLGCSRDELLAAFWPEVAPAAARNRLQVVVSGLRRALSEATPVQVIEYADGGYRINPELAVEVDVKTFERELARGRAAERSGDRRAAVSGYRTAIELYRGDLAADAPYEQWTLLPREAARITFLDALDRLSQIEFADRDLDGCIRTAHRMLEVDPCREDGHRLLMRSYEAQGRWHQALRQYDFCRRVLGATLEVVPSAETEAVYQRIRAGQLGRPAPIR